MRETNTTSFGNSTHLPIDIMTLQQQSTNGHCIMSRPFFTPSNHIYASTMRTGGGSSMLKSFGLFEQGRSVLSECYICLPQLAHRASVQHRFIDSTSLRVMHYEQKKLIIIRTFSGRRHFRSGTLTVPKSSQASPGALASISQKLLCLLYIFPFHRTRIPAFLRQFRPRLVVVG